MFKSLTPYEDVNTILAVLHASVKDILGKQFTGMYLSGSLSNGGFDKYSDIDVLVVTRDEITESVFSSLAEMHQRIARMDLPWAMQLEVSYIPEKAIRRFDRADKRHPHMDRGDAEVLHWMDHESDWILQRHILRERGITLEGPAPQTLIDPISENELRRAVVEVLPFWIDPIEENPSQYLKHQGYQSFIVLSICRMLYTLRYGAVMPKLAAAAWAREELDSKWTMLIERAVLGRENPDVEAAPEDINGTLEFIRYMRDVASKFGPSAASPTPYSDVNEVLNLLLSSTKRILRDQFIGMYLYGSLSSGDFNPESSDIDFVVVTLGMLTEETISKIEDMHKEIWASGLKWADRLEGSYVSVEMLRRDDPSDLACPTVNEGRFFVHTRGSDWVIQLHVIREFGVVVEGPDPKSLIDPVSPDEIRRAVQRSLSEWWFPMLEDPTWLMERGSEHHAFTVITICRALHALEHGSIVSKPIAARWAQDKFGTPWDALIQKALAAQHREHAGFPNEARDFIRFAQDELQKMKRHQ